MEKEQMLTDTELVVKARELLTGLTPIKSDCGDLCGAACCVEPEDGEIIGMALFPGEKALYENKSEWYKIYYDFRGKNPVLVCKGECPREQRPLACRIFPLTPYSKNGKLSVKMDARSAEMCPLYRHRKKGLQREFVQKVEEAAQTLWQSESIRRFIESTSAEIDAAQGALSIFSKEK